MRPEGAVHPAFMPTSAQSAHPQSTDANRMNACSFHTIRAAAAMVATLSLATATSASDGDHERARQALLRGDVLPLAQVIQQLDRQRPGGQVLEVELEHKGGRWIYEIKQIEAGGELVKIKLDAKTGDMLSKPGSASKRTKQP